MCCCDNIGILLRSYWNKTMGRHLYLSVMNSTPRMIGYSGWKKSCECSWPAESWWAIGPIIESDKRKLSLPESDSDALSCLSYFFDANQQSSSYSLRNHWDLLAWTKMSMWGGDEGEYHLEWGQQVSWGSPECVSLFYLLFSITHLLHFFSYIWDRLSPHNSVQKRLGFIDFYLICAL